MYDYPTPTIAQPKTIDRGPFGRALKHCRESRQVSQSKLAERAGFDHSYVSRLESGARSPTRDAIGQLAVALALNASDTDHLVAAGGFLPADVTVLMESEPAAAEIIQLLGSTDVPEPIRMAIRSQLFEIANMVRLTLPSPALP